MAEEDIHGGLSASGRFARMEAALQRIEEKLDTKADEAVVKQLDQRISLIEQQGSAEAREATAMATLLIARVNQLEIVESNRKAIEVERESRDAARYRIVWLLVGFLTIINIALGAVLSLTTLLTVHNV